MPNITDRRRCAECNFELPIEKFPKISKDRRRHTCNRCTRARKMAAECDMSVPEYLSFSAGPCVFCGCPETKAYFFEGSPAPAARVCNRHSMMFRAFKHLDELVIAHSIMCRFPFWLDFLRKNNLQLFKLDHYTNSD
jgi:hypothetical protein